MAYSGNSGLKRVLLATKYSWQGFGAALRHEAAFRQEAILAVILLPLAFYFGKTGIDIALLAGSVILVLIVEILNSAVEAVVDRVGMERHELSARAKDMGSAAVMLSLINVVMVWGLVLFW
jgi:diacylglycerol kinase (ATP)